jgi:hypothetical protein
VKVAGALTTVAGVLAAIVLALMPVSVDVLGTTTSCGAPIARVAAGPSSGEDPTTYCNSASTVRVVIALTVGLVLIVGGVGMLVAAGRNERRTPLAPPGPGWWYDGRNWWPPQPPPAWSPQSLPPPRSQAIQQWQQPPGQSRPPPPTWPMGPPSPS